MDRQGGRNKVAMAMPPCGKVSRDPRVSGLFGLSRH